MKIRFATPDDIPGIKNLAEEIWWPTYTEILDHRQIEFMLVDMYSESALQKQFENGHTFLVAENNLAALQAFASFSTADTVCKIHKLYIHPSQQGKGTGKALLQQIKQEAIKRAAHTIELNVNRNNPAFAFYQKMGFSVYQEIDIPYYQFVLNDYVLRLPLNEG